MRIHLTNVTGLGATQLLGSLLPALLASQRVTVSDVYLSDANSPAFSHLCEAAGRIHRYKRLLPNAVSRLLECTLFSGFFDGKDPLLVLGDLPLRCKARQVVFVQTPHVLKTPHSSTSLSSLKARLMRWVFRHNSRYVQAFIVQTSAMQRALVASYPTLAGKVHTVSQPPPTWLLNARLREKPRAFTANDRLHLIYPAADYPHKNHRVLQSVCTDSQAEWPVEELLLTLSPGKNPAPKVPWIKCAGILQPEAMTAAYCRADALLFLSSAESYGFPLIEAMYLGLPILCADRPYARALCGDSAIYFDPDAIQSIHAAVCELKTRLINGWRPDWSAQLSQIPPNWNAVADRFIDIVEQS